MSATLVKRPDAADQILLALGHLEAGGRIPIRADSACSTSASVTP